MEVKDAAAAAVSTLLVQVRVPRVQTQCGFVLEILVAVKPEGNVSVTVTAAVVTEVPLLVAVRV